MKYVFVISVLLLVVLAACSVTSTATKEEMTIFKTATYGCCGVWSKHIDQDGYSVEEVILQSLNTKKQDFGIPRQLWSCHTGYVDGYFVEGHIPSHVVDKLLEERPDIAGIALPGMPIGTPGMPGPKQEDWIIYAVAHDGSYEEYMVI